jgi:hypothetical protein
MAPPEHLLRGMAPFRRSVFTERGSGELGAEESWEPWEELAKRNLIRPSHATRINLTLFANETIQPGQSSSSADAPSMPSSLPSGTHSSVPENSRTSGGSEMKMKLILSRDPKT